MSYPITQQHRIIAIILMIIIIINYGAIVGEI